MIKVPQKVKENDTGKACCVFKVSAALTRQFSYL